MFIDYSTFKLVIYFLFFDKNSKNNKNFIRET